MTEVVVPSTGELLDLRLLTTSDIAEKIEFYAEVSDRIREFKRGASDELAHRLDFEGRSSADVGEWHIEASKATERDWDMDRLQTTLDDFVTAGTISQAKAQRCIRVKTEPVWGEVKRLLEDPRTAPEISLCFETRAAPRYVRVWRKKPKGDR